jgi:iron complex outermembrane receptor protein
VVNIILSNDTGFGLYPVFRVLRRRWGYPCAWAARWPRPRGKGFIFASLEHTDSEVTSRTRQRLDAIAFQAANPTLAVPNPVQRWVNRSLKRSALRSTPISLTPAIDATPSGTYGEGEGQSDFNWRNPSNTGSAFNPSTAFPGFNLRTIYPTGFTPIFGQEDEGMPSLWLAQGALGDLHLGPEPFRRLQRDRRPGPATPSMHRSARQAPQRSSRAHWGSVSST